MIEAASLGVRAGWQDAGAVRGMKDLQREVQETARTSNSQMKLMEDGAKNALGSMGKMLSGLGIGLGLAAIGGAAIKLGKELVAAGSDAEEMLGKFSVVFGSQADAVTQQLTAFGEAVGRSKFDLQEMAAGVQDTFVPLGFAREEAAKMSVTLTELATDVASFNNASDPEVMNAFTSAIVGNHEAVRQYGIVITEATLSTELMAMGIEKGIKGATEQEKVQARLNLIMKGTSDAQGDAARTSDSWANTMRGLRAVISDTQAEIGLKLLPALTPLLQNLTGFAREIGPQVVDWFSRIASNLSIVAAAVATIDFSRLTSQMDDLSYAAERNIEGLAGWARLLSYLKLDITTFANELGLIAEFYSQLTRAINGDISWDEFKTRYHELSVSFYEVEAAYKATAEEIRNTDFREVVTKIDDLNRANEQAATYWQWHLQEMKGVASSAPDAIGAIQAIVDSLGGLVEQALPENEAGWAAYLEQMNTALSESSDLIAQHSDTQLALIEEYAARRQELALQYQEQDAALAAEGGEIKRALLSQQFDDEMAALEEYYQTRMDLETGAMGSLQDMQAGAMGTLLENLGAFTSEAAERYGSYAQTIVSLEQERDNVLAFLEAQYQNERARLQAAGDTQSLQLLNSAHKAKYSNVLTYYNQRIKTEQTGQAAIYNVAKVYYMHTLLMMRTQMVNQLKTVAATMNALVRSMVGGYGAITAAAYAAKLAQEGKSLAELQAGISAVESMMKGLEGSGVAAAAQASVAFDNWKDSVDDLGGGLEGIGDTLEGIGPKAGGASEKIIDPMKAAAQVVEGLAQMVDKAIASFDVLAEYGGPSPGWVTGYQKLLDAVEVMVHMFATTTQRILDTGVLAKEKREQLANAVDVIGGTLKVISDALRVSQMFEDVEVQTANVGEILDRLAANITLMVQKVIGISTAFAALGKDKLRDAARASEYLVEIMKPWAAAVSAVSALVNLPSVDAQQFIDRVVDQMTALALGMVEVGKNVDRTTLREAAQAAAGILDALKPWEPAIKAIQALVTSPMGDITGDVQRVADQMVLLVQTMARVQIDKDALKEAAKSAGLIVDALKPWEAAAKAVQAVATSPAGGIGESADRLMLSIFKLIQTLVWAQRQIDRAALEELARSAGLIVDALKPWEAAAKAVDAIADSSGERIGLQAERLVGQMLGLIRKLARLAGEVDRTELERLARLAQPLVDALKPWDAAAKAVQSISTSASSRIGPQAERLVGQMVGLARKLARVAGGIDRAELERLARTAQPLIDALKPWEAAAKAVDAISRTSGARIGPQAERLVMQMVGLARKLARVAREMPAGQLQEAARAAALFSDTLKPWEAAMTVVEKFAKFANSSRIGPQAERLVQQMMGLARKLAKAGREVGLADLEFAARVGKLFGEVLEPWEKAISVSNELRMWRELPDLQEKMTRFVRIWVDIVAELSKAVRELSSSGLQAVADFGRALTDLMGGLEAALQVVTDFEFEPPDPTMWGNFTRWVQSTFVSFYDWINQYVTPEPGLPPVPYFDEDGLTAVSLFAQALRDLMGGLEAALGIARDFEFQPPDPTMWGNFTRWVQSVFVSFYDWINATVTPEPPLTEPIPLFGGDGLAAVGAFASALNALMQGLQAALAIARDFDFQEPDPATWNNFFTWATGVFGQFYDYIVATYPTEDPATTFAPISAWAGALGSLMGGLQSALAIAKDFEFVAPDATQWDNFFTWVTDVFEQFRAEIVLRYPEEDPNFAPVTAWGGALGSLMGGLQSALAIAGDFDFQTPDVTQWDAFFEWTTAVFEQFRAEIERRYPADDPEQFAPVTAWANAFSALMTGLQSAISLVSQFEFEEPDPADWDAFFEWSLAVLEDFRDAIIERYPNATAATWEPVVAWSNALSALMQGLQAAVALADSFVFIPPAEVGWDNFFTWVFEVFDAFRLEILERFPENPEEAGQFPAVIALSNAISAIFSGLQSAFSFFMDLQGPGEEFWTFLAGAGGDPDTSPFRQRMGYIIGAITGTMAAFDAWVVQNAPTWTANATQLLDRVTRITEILQNAIELFDFMDNTALPSTAEIEQFVTAVLHLFTTFAGQLANLVGEGGMGAYVDEVVEMVSGFVATTMPPLIVDWHDAGEALVDAFDSGLAGGIGPETTVGTVAYTIAQVRGELAEFTGWWVPERGEGYWYDAGDALVDAFIAGMGSNLGENGELWNMAFAVGQTANAGLEAGAAAGGGEGYGPEGPLAGLGKGAAGTLGWSSPSVSSERNINVTIRFENAPATMDRRTLDELKRTLVYEIQRGA